MDHPILHPRSPVKDPWTEGSPGGARETRYIQLTQRPPGISLGATQCTYCAMNNATKPSHHANANINPTENGFITHFHFNINPTEMGL